MNFYFLSIDCCGISCLPANFVFAGVKLSKNNTTFAGDKHESWLNIYSSRQVGVDVLFGHVSRKNKLDFVLLSYGFRRRRE